MMQSTHIVMAHDVLQELVHPLVRSKLLSELDFCVYDLFMDTDVATTSQ
jgi:hypothetical protein